jgi:hypothetical protein
MAMVLVLGRLSDPSSELRLAEHVYAHSAVAEVLGVPAGKVNEDRLYRALDALLPHKAELEKHLRQKLGELFALDYDLLLYDVTSTYFEGKFKANPLAQRGYSRDQRPDYKQVNLALVVSRSGMPVGYDVFAGNRHDATTLEEIIAHIERLHGRAARIWVLDRGMVSEENVAFLKRGQRRYIVGTPKSMLKRYERELQAQDWRMVHDGLEVLLCPAPDSAEVFILCRSAERQQKEQAIHARFEFLRIGTRRVLRTRTDSSGNFSVPQVLDGKYKFKVTKDGFKALSGTIIVDKRAHAVEKMSFELPVGT